MDTSKYPVEMKVEAHPSGRRTLTFRQGPGTHFQDFDGDLFGNDDAATFYRAVAAKMGVFSACGMQFFYQDMDLQTNSDADVATVSRI